MLAVKIVNPFSGSIDSERSVGGCSCHETCNLAQGKESFARFHTASGVVERLLKLIIRNYILLRHPFQASDYERCVAVQWKSVTLFFMCH